MNYIETDRLILRVWEPEDLPLFAELNKDTCVMRYFPATLTDEQTESFYNRIQAELERNGWGLYAVELKSKGLATEAAKEVLKLAKQKGLTNLYSFTAKLNAPSERVMQKIGMTKVGEFEHPSLSVDSPLRTHVLYQIDL